jgi:MerR family mercuric resistance operon transcriptional regulator
MEDPSDNLTIGGVASAAGVNVETVRFYQRRGLLIEPAKPARGIRRYGPAYVARLRFIKAAQRLGFTLDEIADLLRLEDGTHCAQAADLAAAKLVDVRTRLDDLARIERVLGTLLEECRAQREAPACPLIMALHS